ncbi:hypothetical protein TEA_003282 [Camellia sinensis var. sinensis]|uniref:Uncharacterized protein n=1 Tax=Camellia sinensis var. sinensis TaxID=542762 RepID=A0A4S4DP64_CAMSN|nr:hypothetical protein TEA_003282 [Camellia sinensis var. sinensis]
MRVMLCGDGEVEPNMDQVSQLTLEICKEDVLALFIHKLPILEWEARKDLVHCWSILLKQKGDSTYCCVQYLENHLELLDFLVVSYDNKEIALNCGNILRECIKLPTLANLSKFLVEKRTQYGLVMLNDPVVERWTPVTVKDGDFVTNMVTTDFGQLGQDFQLRMRVNDYLQRFRREERPMGFQGNFTQRVVKGVRPVAYQSSPQGGGFSSLKGVGDLGLSEQPNSLVNTDVGQTEGGLGCRASCDLHLSESGRVAPFRLGGHRRGSVSPSGLELVVHRTISAEAQGSRLVEASKSGTSQLAASKLGARQSRLELDMPRDASSAEEHGSRLLVASERDTSQSAASELVERQS